MLIVRQSTARTVTIGPVLDASGVAVTDGVVADLKIAKNGGAPAALNGSATLTHRHTGHYSLALTASDLDTVGQAEVVMDDTVDACQAKELTVIEEAVYDALFAASALGYVANAPVNVAQWLGSAAATPTVAGVPEVDVTHWLGTAAQGASGRPQVDVELIEGADPTDTIRDAVVDDATRIDASALNTATGATIPAILTDTAEIGVAGAGLTEAGGDGDHLTAINLPNQTMDIVGNITGNLSGSVGSVTGAVGSVTGNVGGNVTGSVGSVATGGIAAASFAAGAIDAAAIAANAIGASELAADAASEIATAVRTELATELARVDAAVTTRATPAQVNSEVDTALADIHLDHLLAATYDPASKPGAADALLNELVESDGGVARYTANALEQAPTGGSAPTAGEIADEVRVELATELGRIDVAVSTRASQTSVDDLPTNAELATALAAADDAVLAAIAALNNLSATQVNAEVDTAITDAALATAASLSALAATVAALNNLSSAQAQTAAAAALTAYDGPTNAEMEARTPTAAVVAKLSAHAAGIVTVVIGTGSTPTSIVLDPSTGVNGGAPPALDDTFNGRVLIITSGALIHQATDITDYVGSTGMLTVTALTGSLAAGTTAVIV